MGCWVRPGWGHEDSVVDYVHRSVRLVIFGPRPVWRGLKELNGEERIQEPGAFERVRGSGEG